MKINKFLNLSMCTLVSMGMLGGNVFANELPNTDTYNYEVTVEEDEMLDNSTLISSETNWINATTSETVEEYILDDGSTVIDTTTVTYDNNNKLARATSRESGSATVDKTRNIYGDGGSTLSASITIYARFSWTGSSATVNSCSHASKTYGNWSFTKDDQSKGNSGTFSDAYVQVKYTTTNQIGMSQSGTFKVTCSKGGTISTN